MCEDSKSDNSILENLKKKDIEMVLLVICHQLN